MSLTTPTRDNRYQLPSWPPTEFTVDLWNAVLGDLADRITDREKLEATFETLKASGIQASLDYIQVNVAPQIANLQTSINLAQAQIDQIIIGGKAPDTLRFGGQLPTYYATAQALADGLSGRVPAGRRVNGKELSADVTLEKADIGLGSVDNTADADKPISSATAASLAKGIRVDAAQVFTEAEKGLARANMGAGVLAGLRNKLLNGNFDVWQNGVVFTPYGWAYTADMAASDRNGTGATVTVSRQAFALGQTDVPGNPLFYYRYAQTVAGSGATINDVYRQPIEGVQTLSGETATFTFYARCASGTVPVRPRITQGFGTSGTPSAPVEVFGDVVNLTTAWQRFDAVFNVPSVSGKTRGTANNDALFATVEAMNKNAVQTIDLARLSFVPGNALADPDPAGTGDDQLEQSLCRRYYRFIPNLSMYPMDTSASSLNRRIELPLEPPMRRAPAVTATPAAEVTSFYTASNPTWVRLWGTVGAVSNWGVVDNVRIDARI